MYINDNNGWGWRAGKDRCRLSADPMTQKGQSRNADFILIAQ